MVHYYLDWHMAWGFENIYWGCYVYYSWTCFEGRGILLCVNGRTWCDWEGVSSVSGTVINFVKWGRDFWKVLVGLFKIILCSLNILFRQLCFFAHNVLFFVHFINSTFLREGNNWVLRSLIPYTFIHTILFILCPLIVHDCCKKWCHLIFAKLHHCSPQLGLVWEWCFAPHQTTYIV